MIKICEQYSTVPEEQQLQEYLASLTPEEQEEYMLQMYEFRRPWSWPIMILVILKLEEFYFF